MRYRYLLDDGGEIEVEATSDGEAILQLEALRPGAGADVRRVIREGEEPIRRRVAS